MRFVALFLFIGFAFPVFAQTATVTSGEHDGFSRLVFNFPKPTEWKLAREVDGYSLSVLGGSINFDTSDIYRRITNERLKKINIDPASGALRLTLDCECYAIPFELQRNILVVDIRDGTPPEGSSFELNINGVREAALKPKSSATTEKRVLPSAKPKDTAALSIAIDEAARITRTTPTPLPFDTGPSLQDARDELLWQLSKGAADGVVDVAKSLPEAMKPEVLNQNMRVGIAPGIDATVRKRAPNQMTGVGQECISDSRLDIGTWADFTDISTGFAQNTTALVGEFDRPNIPEIERTVRYYLALGFGAEARLTLNALKVSPDDRKIWETMSYILDLDLPPGEVFKGMEVCDSAAALWAVLAVPDLPASPKVATPAILRTFSGLPYPLRSLLGPGLANRFLQRNDASTAQTITDAILRSPNAPTASVKLLEAEIAYANGKPEVSEELLEPLSGQIGPVGIQSTINLIQRQADAGKEVDATLSTTAESLLLEAKGGTEEIALQNALALAYASQNRYSEAFDLLPERDARSVPIWKMLAERGNDSAIIQQAIKPDGDTVTTLPAETDRKLARRLIDLGFPDQALFWLAPTRRSSAPVEEADLLLAADAELLRSNSLATLALLDGVKGDTATRLRASAYAALQDKRAVEQFAELGDTEDAARVAKQQEDWAKLMNLKQGDIWQDAAILAKEVAAPSVDTPLDATPDSPLGQLAQTRAALEESEAARLLLTRLLAEEVVTDPLAP